MWPILLVSKLEKRSENWPRHSLFWRIAQWMKKGSPQIFSYQNHVQALCILEDEKSGFLFATTEVGGTLTFWKDQYEKIQVSLPGSSNFFEWGIALSQDSPYSLMKISDILFIFLFIVLLVPYSSE
jgi:hypothetical protein